MESLKILKEINQDRRRFLGTAAMTIAAAELLISGSASAQSGNAEPADTATSKPRTNTSFGSLKQIDAGVLNVGYVEAGPADGTAVILLHGWPYDIHTYVDVAPLLASAGYRVIAPYLRGYGATSFLSSETERNGQQAVIAYAKKFSGRYKHRLIKGGVGHNLPQETPQAFAEAVIEVDD
jgi:pimeloyl-ACP methyl ester carboxylesterase